MNVPGEVVQYRHRGFSLIELMIVVAVVIVMSGGVAMMLGKTEVNTLRANALQVQALFDRARQTALAQRTWTCVTVSPSAGTFKLYLSPSPVASTPSLGSSTQTVSLPSTVGLPVKLGITVAGEPLSAYFNSLTSASAPYIRHADYVGASKDVYLWFDGFGIPNVDSLSSTWPGGVSGSPSARGYGFVTLAIGSGSAVVQVVVYAGTGVTGLRWIRK